MITQPVTIREAKFDDLPLVASLHVSAWQEAYEGILPSAFLTSLSVDKRLREWQRGFQENASDSLYNILIALIDGQLVGFAAIGKPRDRLPNNPAEIYAVYVQKKLWSQGIGHALFEHAIKVFKKCGVSQSYLWVLEANNTAISAYKKWGGQFVPGKTKEFELEGQAFKETLMLFQHKK